MKLCSLKKIYLLFLTVFLSFLFFSPVFAVEGGSLFLSPKSGVYAVSEVFSVKVLLDSAGNEINAAEAELNFNTDELFVEDISLEGSIFSLWTIPPKFSNETGVIEFAGGTKEKFKGSEGLLLTIKFRALKSIVSSARLAAGAILAADGKASNIITSMRSGVYTLEPKEIIEKAEYITIDNSPGVPKVFSKTHPNQNKWYKDKDVVLSWDAKKDISGVRFLVNRSSEGIPNVLYEGKNNSKLLKNIDDGVWYFHLQMKNENGWGKIAHFRFQVDSKKPEYFKIIKKTESDIPEGVSNAFLFEAKDGISGIERYDIQIDQRDPEPWFKKEDDSLYIPPPLEAGKHILLVKAIDKAGNYLLDTASFEVKSLEPPILIKYPDILSTDDILMVKGLTFPNSKLTIWLQKGSEQAVSYNLNSDKKGAFTFIAEKKPEEGIYYLWAEVYDKNGINSAKSEKINFAVELPKVMKIALSASKFLSVIIPFVALLLLLGLISGYIWYRLDKLKGKVK